MDVRVVQESFGVLRILFGTGRQRLAIDVAAQTNGLQDLILWLKRLAAGDLPASVSVASPDRTVLLQAVAADRVGMAFVVGGVAGTAAFQAILRPAAFARAARLAMMALMENRFDRALWPDRDPGTPPWIVLPDPWFDDAVSTERAGLLNEIAARYDTVEGWDYFRGSTTDRLQVIARHGRSWAGATRNPG